MDRDLIQLAACLAALMYFSDRWFIVGAAQLANRLKMSTVVVGVLIVGFGTSAPELVVSILAILEEGPAGTELAMGNVVGSNVANLTLVLAIPALVYRGGVEFPEGTPREAYFSTIAVAALATVLLLIDYGHIEAWHGSSTMTGVGLLLALVILLLLVQTKGSKWGGQEPPEERSGLNPWIRTLVGLVGTVLAAHFLVDSATSIAEELGWTTGFVGFTLVALGTSLPELVTVLAAARQRQSGLIIGNLLGSNLFNSVGVGGVIFFTHGVKSFDPPQNLDRISIIGMVGVSVLILVFLKKKNFLKRPSKDRIDSREAVVLLVAYGLLISRMVVTATG